MKTFMKHAGIPLNKVGPRLLELEKAIEEHAMAIGAELDYHVDFVGTENERVRSATLTVYFFEKEEDKTPENLGNSKAVKNPEE